MRKLALICVYLPLVAVVLVSGPSLVNGQRFAPGYCPTVAAHENFDKTKFFGNWIEVEKTPSIFDLMMRCLVVDYSDDQDNTVNVVVRGISLAGLPLTVNGDGLLQDVHRSGFYSIRYGFGVPFQGTLTTIIDTDYEDYAVVYSCTNSLLSGVFHSEYIWVLSRSGKISNPTRQNIYEKLDKLAINRSGLTMSDRSSCPANSSTVARESDKDLAGVQGAGPSSSVNLSGLSPSSSAGSPSDAIIANGGPSATPVANLEKASVEPTQKSVVVPLLYDLPSPVSSSSVGSNSKPSQTGAAKAAGSPPAPVDNKLQQLALSIGQQSKPSAPSQAASKPVQQSPAASVQQQSQQQQQQVASQSQQSSSSQSSPASPSSSSPSQSSSQMAGPQSSKASQQAAAGQQQQSLMAKIQNPKP